MSFFSVGQKVVCVRGYSLPHSEGYGDEALPIAGLVYTIAQIGIGLYPPKLDVVSVRLVELKNKARQYRGGFFEPSFNGNRFRPLTDTKSSISFTEGAPLDSEHWDGRKGKVRA